MGLETATYINGLVNTNPTAGDPVSQGDDHIRLVKATLLSTFPNVTGAVNTTHTDLNGATKSHITNGYQKLAGGLYMQWGTAATNASGVATFTFPVAFPNAHLNTQATYKVGSLAGNRAAINVNAGTTTSVSAYLADNAGGAVSGADILFFSIGY
jgi:hypothetical protein